MNKDSTNYPTVEYLSTAQAAERIGISRQAFHRRKPPKPSVMIGSTPGWTAEIIDAWNKSVLEHAQKPGRKPQSQ